MKKRERPDSRKLRRFRLAWPLGLLLVCACQSTGPEPGTTVTVGDVEDARLRVYGEEVLLTTGHGTLAVGPTDSEAERVDALAGVLRRERALFGAEDVEPASLIFLQGAREETVTPADGAEQRVMLLHQVHAGAAVIDRQVVGIWSWEEGAPALRSVRGSLVEVGDLPRPAPLDEPAREAVNRHFAAWLAERGEEAETLTYMEHPVVHSRQRLAGYLALNTRTMGEGGSLATTAVLIDPASGALAVVADRPVCLAHSR